MDTITDYARLLLVEDNDDLALLTQQFLQASGYQCKVIRNGLEARDYIVEQQPDLTILDVMLPGLDGLAICRQVRPNYKKPILMLTARTDPTDEILGLEIGADDYLFKPVEPKRLLSRIRAMLRRATEFNEASDSSNAQEVLFIDKRNRVVTCYGEPIDLTGPEFDLLSLLASQPGQVFSRDAIMQSLRGIEYDGFSRVIDMIVSGLRAKLPFEEVIKTVRGKGYLLLEGHLLVRRGA
ncbi:MAG: response regulator transcription factor [Saccharospirillum sp.]|nr:response regulator transcription factor [Saccharospirillum sp.]